MQASLDKQIKELNLRIVDLETKSLSLNSSRPSNVNKRLESRIEELQNQLNQSTKDSSRLKTADKGTREAVTQHLQESERQRSRLEEELKSYETRVDTMRQTMDEMVGGFFVFASVGLTSLTHHAANEREQPPTGQAAGGTRGG